MIRHRDDVEPIRRERGHIVVTWRRLTGDDTVRTGVSRVQVDRGKSSTPGTSTAPKRRSFYVLGGPGLAPRGGDVHEVAAGDGVARRVRAESNTPRAGDDGLDVLVFGIRCDDERAVLLRGVGVVGGIERLDYWDGEA